MEKDEVPIASEYVEGYSSPSDVLRLRAELISAYLRQWDGIYISTERLLSVLAATGMTIEIDKGNGGTALDALKYLRYEIDSTPENIEPISLTRYKISRRKTDIGFDW